MPVKFTLRNDDDHMRLVTLISTAFAALINTLQVMYPFSADPNGWGAQDGIFGSLFVIIFAIGGVLTAGVQFARWDLPMLRGGLRWGAVVVSGGFFVLINIALLSTIPEVMKENADIANVDYFYAYNYSMLMWQAVNTWTLPLFAVGAMKNSNLDRWLLVGFGALATVYAAVNAWITAAYPLDMPALLHHWVGYAVPPVVLAFSVLCAALIGVVRKK